MQTIVTCTPGEYRLETADLTGDGPQQKHRHRPTWTLLMYSVRGVFVSRRLWSTLLYLHLLREDTLPDNNIVMRKQRDSIAGIPYW